MVLRKLHIFFLAFLFSPLFTSAAVATSWERAIEKVNRSAEKYREYAVKVGGTSWAGTMYNGYMAQEHMCAILGRMLGEKEAIKHLEDFSYPPLNSQSDPHDLLVFSISLENWVWAARSALEFEQHERISNWNLDCVGHFEIPAERYIKNKRPNAMFKVDRHMLHVYGDIESGFAGELKKILEKNPQIREVTLGSGGGSVYDALIAGSLIRKNGLDTSIWGNCYSACPLVFLGGTRRVVWAAPYRLGFHQMYTGGGDPVAFNAPIYKAVFEYVAAMGADPIKVVNWMQSAEPAEMFEPELEKLCEASVATFVQRLCSSD